MKMTRQNVSVAILAASILAIGFVVSGCHPSAASGGADSLNPAPSSDAPDSSGGGGGITLNGTSFVEQPVPSTKIASLTGKPISLAQYKGQVVMIDIWAPWCGPCRLGLPFTQRLYKSFKGKGLKVLTMTADPAGEVSQFIKKTGYTFPVLMDGDGSISTFFGVQGLPTTIFVDKNGNIVGKEEGLNPQTTTIEELKKAGLAMGNFAPKNDPLDNSISG